MKYVIISLIALFHLSVSGQSSDFINRKLEIEKCTEVAYSIKEFLQIADCLQLTIDELCNFPVISPIKKPQRISSGFGRRKHPVYKYQKLHTGIDIPQIKGTPVYASGNGTVVRKGCDSGYGYFIEIRHAGGFRSFYAHLSRTLVDVGDSVSIAQQIACVGNSGVTTGSHLHYEVRKGNYFLNPIGWCCLFKIVHDK